MKVYIKILNLVSFSTQGVFVSISETIFKDTIVWIMKNVGRMHVNWVFNYLKGHSHDLIKQASKDEKSG